MKFYNREKEIAELQRIQRLAYHRNSRMTVVTGRRRIGKTSLIKRALSGGETPMLYFFVGRKAEANLVKDFAAEIQAKLGIVVSDGFSSIAALLSFLMEVARSRCFTLVIDEFQELMRLNPSVVSDIQNIWDANKDNTHINLVLSGSVRSMMRKIFMDAGEPLFGRADNVVNLKPFKLSVIREILADYNESFTSDDLLMLYAISGGVPKYIELLCDNECVTANEMLNYFTSELSPFIEEGRMLLISEFGRDYAIYFSILQCMAGGATTQSEIMQLLNGQAIGGYLDKLENVYGIVTKHRPVLAKPRAKNVVHYEIADNFLRFWFHFVESNQSLLELGNYDDFQQIVSKQYPTYSGWALERYFRQKLAEDGGYKLIGGWWQFKNGKEANEIDIIAIRTEGKAAVVAEVKRQRRNYDHKLFMSKVDCLKNAVLSGYDITPRLFTLEDM